MNTPPNQQQTETYTITGMSCGHCENAVKEELADLGTVHVTYVSAEEGKLVLQNNGATEEEIIAAVEEAGYEATRN